MNIILPTIGSAGDVNPMIALGIALRERGHQAIVVTNGYFKSNVEAAGLDFIELGTAEAYLQLTNDPNLWHPTKSFETIAKAGLIPGTRLLYDILAQMNPADTLVAAPGICFGARLAQEKLGMPLVTIHLQPSVLISVHQAPVMGMALPERLPTVLKRLYFDTIDALVLDKVLATPLNEIRAELGLTPTRHIWTRWMHSPQAIIGLFPNWFAPHQPDWPANVHLTGFVRYDADETHAPMDNSLADFLAAGEAPIVFTPGSAMKHAREFFETSVAAAQALGRRALLITQYPEQLPVSLPPTVCHVPYAPFSEVFPHAAAVVHHGGIGTTAQTLAAGVPHLVVPFSHDQPDNAVRLERIGVGKWLAPGKYQTPAVIHTLEHLLGSNEVKERVKQYAAKVDFDAALRQTCELIEAQAPVKN